jgi:hypothetical protein
MRKTTGGARAPSVVVNTIRHAGPISSWSIETKARVPLRGGFLPLRERSTTKEGGVMGFYPEAPSFLTQVSSLQAEVGE